MGPGAALFQTLVNHFHLLDSSAFYIKCVDKGVHRNVIRDIVASSRFIFMKQFCGVFRGYLLVSQPGMKAIC